MQSQCISSGPERHRAPARCLPLSDISDPACQTGNGLVGNIHQRIARRPLFGQRCIEELLKRPRRLTEVIQTDHAGTALERMERPAQSGLVCKIGRIQTQCGKRLASALDNVTGFFEEDILELCRIILVQVCGGGLGRCAGRSWGSRCHRCQAGQIVLDLVLHDLHFWNHHTLAAHHGLELAKTLVINEKGLRQRALKAQHVD